MGAPRLREDLLLELAHVVGTEQPERGLGRDRDVEQRLVELALTHLAGPSARPDRFADTTHRLALHRALIDELLPRGNDPSGVATQLAHVDETDAVREHSELIAQPRQAGADDADHDRLPGQDPFTHERRCAGEELLLTTPEERVMAVSLRHDVDG